METFNHLGTTIDNAAKSGLSWTKRSKLVNDALTCLINLGRTKQKEKITTTCVTIEITRVKPSDLVNILVTGNENHDSIVIGLRLDTGELTLDRFSCDINAIAQRIAQLLLSNKPQETMQALVYC